MLRHLARPLGPFARPVHRPAERGARGGRRPVLAGATLAAVVLLAGCGTDAPSQRELAEALVDSGLSRAVADCAAEALTSTLSDDELTELAERGSGAAPVDDPDDPDDSADQLRDALAECRTLMETTTTLPFDDGASTAPVDDGSSTTVAPTGDPDDATIDSVGP